MNPRLLLCCALPLVPLALTQCVTVDPGAPSQQPGYPTQLPGTAPQQPGYATQLPAGFSQPLTAVTGPGAVTIREGERTLCSFRTAMPNVEETRWHSEQEQIVVKSRGGHGPATVQLFDSRTGAELGRVMAYDVRNGQPGWAAPFAE